MKSWGKTLVLLTIGVIVISHVTRAQLGSISPIALLPDAADGQASVPDSIVRIAAEAEGLSQVDPASLPFFASCWWTVSPGGAPVPMPCPPQDLSVPIYQIVDGIYLVDETGGAVSVSVQRTTPMRAVTTASITSAVESQGSAIASLIEQVQATAAAQQNRLLARAMGINVPMPGEGGGTNSYYLGGSGFTIPDYGTNLWIAQTAVAAGNLAGIGTNTIADVQYEIQSRTNLAQADWQSEGFIYGSPATNWTPLSVPQTGRTNLFIRLRSWADDGSGLPFWWQLQYFGTNGIDPYNAPAGDGWSNLQKFQNGWSPNQFNTPAAPRGFHASYYPATGAAKLSWLPSPGVITGYSLQKLDYRSGQTTNFTLAANVNAYEDNVGSYISGYNGPFLYVDYTIQAQYGTNGRSASASASIEDASVPQATVFTGLQGQLMVAIQNPPSDLSSVEIYRQQDSIALDYNAIANMFIADGTIQSIQSPLNDGSFQIPASKITNGIFQLPYSEVPAYFAYGLSVQTIGSNGVASGWASLSASPNTLPNTTFVDARQQLKDNLRFLLRSADIGPFALSMDGNYSLLFAWPINNYVYSGFYGEGGLFSSGAFHPLLPIQANCIYRNFVFDQNNLNEQGFLNTGCNGGNWYLSDEGGYWPCLTITNYPVYLFNLLGYLTNNAAIPSSQLGSSQTQWLLPNDGVINQQSGETFPNVNRNFYGLTNHSAKCAYAISNQVVVATVYSGNNFPSGVSSVNYIETDQPVFSNSGYYFARPSLDPLPESSGFETTNVTLATVQALGTSQQIAGYARLGIQNAFADTYAYLGQYFDKAYTIDANAHTTTNVTGILSPYGNFFATQPGPAALVTMPDLDSGARGTCTVYTVSLQLDANHDGKMDLGFNSTDITSASSPYIFWRNNNFDRSLFDSDDGVVYDDDAPRFSYANTAANPQGKPIPDYDYTSYQFNPIGGRAIPTQRDLEDYARLWICGISTNLLGTLSAGCTVTLSWGYQPYTNPSNPTIDLFSSVEADGGLGYLTNATLASIQVQASQGQANSAYIGRLGPGQSIQLNPGSGWLGNHFLWCGVSNGTGGLTFTIADANNNVLAQTAVYIQVRDIKQMYERWTVGDVPNRPPNTVPASAVNDLAVNSIDFPFVYNPPQNTNIPYILFVHGWNMNTEDKDRFSETAFKRLYWQGYQGRFGVFRWPTDSGFKGISSIATNPREKDNYDRSEYTAWQSAMGLLNKLTDLNATYPGHVYMLAHSMGNVVAGEALRLAGSNQVVNTYVASQAAVSAHTYDTNIANYSFSYPLLSSQAKTPNIYGNWFAGNYGGGARSVVDFYNTNDYALQRDVWQLNQLLKPDQFALLGGTHWDYTYNGPVTDPPPWNHFDKAVSLGFSIVYFDIVNVLTNRYEVMGLAAQSWTTALGATPGAQNIRRSVDLSLVWPADSVHPAHPFDEHFYHSAEFRGDYWQQQNYWLELLGANAFNLK